MNKKIFILLFFLFVLISMSAVSAGELDEDIIASSGDAEVLAIENDVNTVNNSNDDADGENLALESDVESDAGQNKEIYGAKYAEGNSMPSTLGADSDDLLINHPYAYDPIQNSVAFLYVDDWGRSPYVVTLDLNDEAWGATIIYQDSGIATINLGVLNAGSYDVHVECNDHLGHKFTRNAQFSIAKHSADIFINKTEMTLNINESVSVGAFLNPSNAGNLSYSSSNPGVADIDSDGIIHAYGQGTAIITISFGGNENYYPAGSQTVTVNVNNMIHTEIAAEGLELSVGDDGQINYVLTPSDAVGEVRFMSNDTNVAYVDPETGFVDARGEGVASVTVSFIGTDLYASSQTTVTVTVKSKKIPTALTVNNVSVGYGDDAALVATLINNDTGAVISYAHIVATIDGNSYTGKTNSKGKVKFTISGLDVGNHTAVVSYAGNFKYGSSSTTANVEVTSKFNTILTVNNVSVGYGDDAALVATLINNDTGKAISYAHIVATINGNSYTGKTNSKGKVKFTISGLDVGNYNAVVSYAGNFKYNPTSTNANVEVTSKVDTILSVNNVSIYYGEDATFVATLTNKGTGEVVSNENIVLTIDGKSYTGKTNSKGKVKFTISGLEVGNHTAVVSYAGNFKYGSSSTTANVEVASKFNTSLTVKNVSIGYGDDARLVATLINTDVGKAISYAHLVATIDGKSYTGKTNSIGKVLFTISGLDAGDYNAVVSYAGNFKYEPSSATAKVHVDS